MMCGRWQLASSFTRTEPESEPGPGRGLELAEKCSVSSSTRVAQLCSQRLLSRSLLREDNADQVLTLRPGQDLISQQILKLHYHHNSDQGLYQQYWSPHFQCPW